MSNKDVIENLEFCLYNGRCTKCSVGEKKIMLSCRTLLEYCRNALKNSVEVVRCKDCKLRYTEGCPFMYWDCHGELVGDNEDNDFCSYGERKEE